MRLCSRSSCHARQRACTFCKIPSLCAAPIGPVELIAHACVLPNEKLVVKNSAVTKMAPATMYAPLFSVAKSIPAINVPATPPAGIAPRTSGKGIIVNKEGIEITSKP